MSLSQNLVLSNMLPRISLKYFFLESFARCIKTSKFVSLSQNQVLSNMLPIISLKNFFLDSFARCIKTSKDSEKCFSNILLSILETGK